MHEHRVKDWEADGSGGAVAAAAADDAALQGCLGRALGRALGRPVVVAEILRRRCDAASSYDADVIVAVLDSGERLKVFFKNLGVSRFPKDDARRRRDRERGVYQHLLGRGDLGTARCYGSAWDEAAARFWMFLEFVEGPELRFCELDGWVTAASWLGRLHGRFAREADRLRACEFLVRHDADFFRSKAEGALRHVAGRSPELGGRLRRVLGGYDRRVEIMAGQPPTLVHGHYRACNVIIDAGHNPPRICPVDWEQAALGCALYDVAYLADGFEGAVLDRFIDAYRYQAAEQGVPVSGRDEAREVVRCYRFFMPLHRLSRVEERGLTLAKVEKAIAQLEGIRNE
jgi:hypothetical protein